MLRWLLRKPRRRWNLLQADRAREWLPRRFELHRGRKLSGLLLRSRSRGQRRGLWWRRLSVKLPLFRRLS